MPKPACESSSRKNANAVTLSHLLYHCQKGTEQKSRVCFFFLTEIGRPQCLINLCFWVSVIANNVGCNIASVCYCGFFLSLVSYITPLTPSFGISFFVLKTFPSVHFLQTFRDNSQTTSHHQTMSTNHHHGFTKAMKLLATSMLQCRLVITIRENLHK